MKNILVYKTMKFFALVFTAFKSIWGFLALCGVEVLTFFLPVRFDLYLMGGLIVGDIVTALIALFMESHRNSTTLREAFTTFYIQWTSKRAFDSIPKMLWYAILILAFYAVGHVFGEPTKAAALITGVISYVEIRSIIENGDKAFGTNLWELLIDNVRKLFKLK